jgi:uncharacterized protein (DUF934 family)
MLVRLDAAGIHEAEDTLMAVADGQALPPGAIVVTLAHYQAERDSLLARKAPLGVRLETGESPEKLGADLEHFAAVVLHVPYFKDGRAFSWARLLRTRLRYKGEIRITGHVLLDQLAFYARVGVDAFDIAPNVPFAEVRAAFGEISNVYQPSVDKKPTIRQLRGRLGNATIPSS